MHFAHPLPWWLALLLAAVAVALAILEYRRAATRLTAFDRAALAGLRALTLVVLMLLLFRPVVTLSPSHVGGAVVPVLVDVSRSMRIADSDGQPRLARAKEILRSDLLPALSDEYRPELFAVGETVAPASIDSLAATARRSDLVGAIDRARERFRDQNVPGIFLISDGGDTGEQASASVESISGGPPVFALGVGSVGGVKDREVAGVAAAEQQLDQASVDLQVSVTSRGFGRTPFELRILANGQQLESRRIVPPSDVSSVGETFTLFPDPLRPTVYTAEIPGDPAEPILENNTRSVLVNPAGRKRRLLIVEGAPGFEHSFIKRAWAADKGLDVDSVVRKGKNADANDTFLVQAAPDRVSLLMGGFPQRREGLYLYDAVVIANVEADLLTRAQLTMIEQFVSERGGGLLVIGGRSFTSRGLIGTPIEEALPVELTDRRGGLARASLDSTGPTPPNKLLLTSEGEAHPIMRIGTSPADTQMLWAQMPVLPSSAMLGAARPGATILAVASASGGGLHPVIAVQRYGRGRSMVFGGEASWRWKMMLASSDRSYERFWRQAARWLAAPSPDPVAISVPDLAEPLDSVSIEVDARDAAFAPAPDAHVQALLTTPGGEERALTVRRADAAQGRFNATIRPDQAGLYRIRVEARRGASLLGAADRWMYVGGSDREFIDPRLNEAMLGRLARASGGRYASDAARSSIHSWLRSAALQTASPRTRDVWHEPLVFIAVIGLLSAEWVLRRKRGLR